MEGEGEEEAGEWNGKGIGGGDRDREGGGGEGEKCGPPSNVPYKNSCALWAYSASSHTVPIFVVSSNQVTLRRRHDCQLRSSSSFVDG